MRLFNIKEHSDDASACIICKNTQSRFAGNLSGFLLLFVCRFVPVRVPQLGFLDVTIMQQGGKSSFFVILVAASAATAGLIY